MKRTTYETHFVDKMPSILEDGILYIAPHYNCVMHNCMCGCGEKVCTPIDVGQWKWNYDGKNVSLNPSVGNFQYKCKSHYFLVDGKVKWCGEPEIVVNKTLYKECQSCPYNEVCMMLLECGEQITRVNENNIPSACLYENIKNNPDKRHEEIKKIINQKYGIKIRSELL